MNQFPTNITINDKYAPAMQITDLQAAAQYFELCVEHCMRCGNTREQAEKIERSNLGYYAGYYSNETRERVERLFACEHPVFGAIKDNGPPSIEAAFFAGVRFARESNP